MEITWQFMLNLIEKFYLFLLFKLKTVSIYTLIITRYHYENRNYRNRLA